MLTRIILFQLTRLLFGSDRRHPRGDRKKESTFPRYSDPLKFVTNIYVFSRISLLHLRVGASQDSRWNIHVLASIRCRVSYAWLTNAENN